MFVFSYSFDLLVKIQVRGLTIEINVHILKNGYSSQVNRSPERLGRLIIIASNSFRQPWKF